MACVVDMVMGRLGAAMLRDTDGGGGGDGSSNDGGGARRHANAGGAGVWNGVLGTEWKVTIDFKYTGSSGLASDAFSFSYTGGVFQWGFDGSLTAGYCWSAPSPGGCNQVPQSTWLAALGINMWDGNFHTLVVEHKLGGIWTYVDGVGPGPDSGVLPFNNGAPPFIGTSATTTERIIEATTVIENWR